MKKKSMRNKINKKRGAKIIKPIVSIAIILSVFYLAFTYNLQFKEFVLTTYYKILPEKTSYQSEIVSCQDEEGTPNYFTKGNLKIIYKNGITDLYVDTCDSFSIKEYSCELGRVKIEQYECEAGCFDGVCLIPEEEIEISDEELTAKCNNYIVSSPLNAIAQNEYSFYSALNAIDGELATHWFGSPNTDYPKWLYFDLGEKKCISEADLYAFSQDIPITGNLQASQDAVHWKTFLSNITIKETSLTGIKFPQIITARYIRWQETSSARSFGELTDIRFKMSDISEEKVASWFE